MYFSGEIIFFISLLVGLMFGCLVGTIVRRTGVGLVGDIAAGITAAFIGCWLVLAARDTASVTPHAKAPESAEINSTPNYEPVVLPLAQLRPLLKPIVYRTRAEICDTLAEAARNNDLPPHFFIRLLYQESSFRPYVISSAGALGIAQFTQETATDRGLDNPFDPAQAIPASASLLRNLSQKFGNLGLAAAAYNAGPKRIQDWLANKGQLPQETQDYVKTITSWPVETWTGAQAGSPAVKLPQLAPCQELAGLLAWNGPDEIPLPPRNPRTQEPSQHVTVAQQSVGARGKPLHTVSQAAKRGQDAKASAGGGN
ncbi:MAG TPA: lytic transglycosylase domain-containing protein [Pseudolabrys sp.]|nr:lytic transglycosylase domain-containing protein [Pseudolabrys sp.]